MALKLKAEEVTSFIAALNDWPNSEFWCDEQALAVGPFTSFYFSYRPETVVETTLAMVEVYERFERLVGKPFVLASHPRTENFHPVGSKRLPDLREAAEKTRLNKQFIFSATDEKNLLSSPATAANLWRSSTWDGVNNNGCSYIQLHYRWQWWLDHRDQWRDFVLGAADLLQAEQVYSGFAMGTPPGLCAQSDVAPWERALAPHFFGLDIDFTVGMSRKLQTGVRPPTWGFLLSNHWRERLGITRAQVRKSLADPQIRIEDRASGQWIELSEAPSLCPVGEGVPAPQMMLNTLLRPIRLKYLSLDGPGDWNGDLCERFGSYDDSRRLARFDADSDWPDAEARRAPLR